ncbi:MAG: hypothetical protein Q9211_007067, partial [Gyalolechia sp. 1 TL-2023]
YDDGYLDDDVEDEGITAEDCWTVISSFFDAKGLVSQQLDSFDEFVQSTMQELIDEHSLLTLDQHAPQSDDADPIVLRRYEIKFGQIAIARPSATEADGVTVSMLPQEARLRNLTYASPLFLEMSRKVSVARERQVVDEETEDGVVATQRSHGGTHLEWEIEAGSDTEDPLSIFVGRLPVMLKSKYCTLRQLSEAELFKYNECPYDQGGYFIINGSEKVLIAQERSAANIVQVFKKSASNTPYVAEIRSALEKGSRLISSMSVALMAHGESKKGGVGHTIHADLPYIIPKIPIVIVFRALGIVSDEDILNHICYDRSDTQMLEMLKPCLEEAFVIQDREVALDFLGKRGKNQKLSRNDRIKFARD